LVLMIFLLLVLFERSMTLVKIGGRRICACRYVCFTVMETLQA
jgi:hypothetical protein